MEGLTREDASTQDHTTGWTAGPAADQGPRRRRVAVAVWLALLAACGGIVAFLVLVVGPSAGAAGGCGGG